MKKIIILTLTILALVVVLTLTAGAETLQPGDMNGDGFVNSDDAIYLLRHTLNPEEYPLAKTPMSETGCINHKVKTIVTNANCITVGKIEYYCDDCDYYEFEYTQTSEGKYFGDHKYEYAGYSILETGCYIQNSDRYECVFCGDEKYEFVSETYNHDYETLTERNGCEVKTYDKCVNCGDIINEEVIKEINVNIPCKNHIIVSEYTIPTCTEYGYMSYFCNSCSYFEIETCEKYKGHDFCVGNSNNVGPYIEFINPFNTCEDYKGVKCENCDYIKYQDRPIRTYHKSLETIMNYQYSHTGCLKSNTKCINCETDFTEYVKFKNCGNATIVYKFEGVLFVYNDSNSSIIETDSKYFFYIPKDFLENKTVNYIKEKTTGDILNECIQLENGDIIVIANKEYNTSCGLVDISIVFN